MRGAWAAWCIATLVVGCLTFAHPGASGSPSLRRPDRLLRAGVTHRSIAGDNSTVTRSWKCRLRMHKWDDRENPETKETYQVCLRCDAYRERARAAPGAGAAGASSGGFGLSRLDPRLPP